MAPRPLTTQLPGLAGWVLATFAAGSVGALASSRSAAFYAQLARPAWAPPAWLFGPVWSALYLAMAVAAWLVWRERGFKGASGALGLFVVQLVANAMWTWLFFGLRSGVLATVEIGVLWVLIVATILAFRPVSRAASLLLTPYLAWVGFAAALTWSLWRRNPAALG